MKAVGQVTQGVAAYDAGKYTRRAMKINARNTLNESVSERDRIRLAARVGMGRQIVDQASSGFAVGSGSAIDALRESATARELDLMTSRYNASARANAFKQQGDQAYAQGYSGLVGGLFSGAATLVDTVASAAFGGAGGAGAGGAG